MSVIEDTRNRTAVTGSTPREIVTGVDGKKVRERLGKISTTLMPKGKWPRKKK